MNGTLMFFFVLFFLNKWIDGAKKLCHATDPFANFIKMSKRILTLKNIALSSLNYIWAFIKTVWHKEKKSFFFLEWWALMSRTQFSKIYSRETNNLCFQVRRWINCIVIAEPSGPWCCASYQGDLQAMTWKQRYSAHVVMTTHKGRWENWSVLYLWKQGQ